MTTWEVREPGACQAAFIPLTVSQQLTIVMFFVYNFRRKKSHVICLLQATGCTVIEKPQTSEKVSLCTVFVESRLCFCFPC